MTLCLYVKVHEAYLRPQVRQQYTHTPSLSHLQKGLASLFKWLVVFKDSIIIKRGLEVRNRINDQFDIKKKCEQVIVKINGFPKFRPNHIESPADPQ